MATFQIFNPLFNDEQLEEDFQDFFTRYGLDPLFSKEHRAQHNITVTWTDARSVVNPGGSYHRVLTNFADMLSIAHNNQNFDTVLFQVLYYAKTFQKMINNIKKIIDEFSVMPEKFLHNMWNAVKYAEVVGASGS